MTRSGYAYSIIRYVHDPVSGECLNIGVVLSSPTGFEFRVPSSLVRVKSAFPDANVNTIRHSLELIEKRLLASTKASSSLGDALAEVLPPDESSIRASCPGVGVTSNLKLAADELLDRLVLKCERDFESAAVLENRGPRVSWQQTVELKLVVPSNDEMYQHADRVLLRA